MSALQQRSANPAIAQLLFSSCDHKSLTMTLELDLESDMMNQHAKYLGLRPFTWKVIVRRQTCTRPISHPL